MIDEEPKKKLLEELEKTGNVYFACLKTGVPRSTFYRWCKKFPEFKALTKAVIKNGRENSCDIAEYALMKKVKEGDFNAIKYLLSHNSPRYKPQKQTSTVIMKHQSNKKEPVDDKAFTIDDIEKIARGEYEIISDEEATALKAERERNEKEKRKV